MYTNMSESKTHVAIVSPFVLSMIGEDVETNNNINLYLAPELAKVLIDKYDLNVQRPLLTVNICNKVNGINAKDDNKLIKIIVAISQMMKRQYLTGDEISLTDIIYFLLSFMGMDTNKCLVVLSRSKHRSGELCGLDLAPGNTEYKCKMHAAAEERKGSRFVRQSTSEGKVHKVEEDRITLDLDSLNISDDNE